MTAPWDRDDWPGPHPMQHKFDAYHADQRRRRIRRLRQVAAVAVVVATALACWGLAA